MVWVGEATPFSIEGWKGRYDNSILGETVKQIFTTFFSQDRQKTFKLFFTSDYKYTYIGQDLLLDGRDVYLKYYRVCQAPSKIRLRNLLRGTIARKGMNLYYPLKQKGIEAVQPLFYAMGKKVIIPDEAIFASASAGSNETLEPVLHKMKEEGNLLSLVKALGSYVGYLHRQRVLYGELYRNLIPLADGNEWRFVLCDLDEMRSLSGMSDKHRNKYLKKLRTQLAALGGSALDHFDEAYQRSLRQSIAAS